MLIVEFNWSRSRNVAEHYLILIFSGLTNMGRYSTNGEAGLIQTWRFLMSKDVKSFRLPMRVTGHERLLAVTGYVGTVPPRFRTTYWLAGASQGVLNFQ